MTDPDASSESDADGRFTADRFIPATSGASMNSIYAVVEEARVQTNQSPDPSKGMYMGTVIDTIFRRYQGQLYPAPQA